MNSKKSKTKQHPKATVTLCSSLAACCATEASRYTIASPRVIAKNGKGVACATNGRIAVVKPITGHMGGDVDCILPSKALGNHNGKTLKTIRVDIGGLKASTFEMNRHGLRTRVHCDDQDIENSKFPPIKDVYPTEGDYACIVISPELLISAMRAVQSKSSGVGGVALFVPVSAQASKTKKVNPHCTSSQPNRSLLPGFLKAAAWVSLCQ